MIIYLILTTLLVSSLGAAPNSNLKPNGRIIGGEEVDITNYPYQVAVEFVNTHRCGGVIISDEWLLTAAVCIPVGPRGLNVRSGSNTTLSGGTFHYSVYMYRHPQFDGKNYDIGLVSVNPKFTFSSTVQPIAITDKRPEAGTPAVVTGWGAFSANDTSGHTTNLELQEVSILGQELCDSYTGDTVSICTTPSVNGPCGMGDSGDPLVAGGVLLGLVSMYSCGNDSVPVAYTDVTQFRDWIRSYTGV